MRLRFGRAATATLIVISGIGVASQSVRAANLDEACGGPDKITCNSALWCRKPAGQCSAPDAAGTCEKAPDFCMRMSRPVCGCNGKTYQNECDARHAKVQVDYAGRCKKPPAPPASKTSK